MPTFISVSLVVLSQLCVAGALSNPKPQKHHEVMPFAKDDGAHDVAPVTVMCEDRNITLPMHGYVLKNPSNGKIAMYCMNAKIGSSTVSSAVYHVLEGKPIDTENQPHDSKNSRNFVRRQTVLDYVKSGKEEALCNFETIFTIIRNPWDRVKSAFADKVNSEVFVPGHKNDNATFAEFLHALSGTDPIKMNAHWKPVSENCQTDVATYTDVYKIEHGLEHPIADVFEKLGVTKPHTLSMLKKIGARSQQSHNSHGLSARREMYNTDTTSSLKQLVEKVYADDIAFGGYEFDRMA